MKRFIICLTAVSILGCGASAYAQNASGVNSLQAARDIPEGLQEIRFGAGVRGPVDRNLGWGASEVLWLSYARYGHRNLGYRIGAEYMPQNMDVDSYIGVPVAFTARTRARSFSQAVTTGLESAAIGAVRDAVYGYEPTARSILGDFILGLFNRAEFFAGLTPGYVAGTNVPTKKSQYDTLAGDWTEQRTMTADRRLSLSADVGFSMSFRIWRFNLGFVPSVHYFLTRNYVSIHSSGLVAGGDGGATVTETPVRFQYSVLGALSYTF